MHTHTSDSLRILIYGINYSPELTGIGRLTGDMSVYLAGRRHEVRVVSAPPYYPEWRIRDDYRGELYRNESAAEPGMPRVFRTPLYVPSNPSGAKRTLHLLSFMLGSIPTMLRQIFWKPDIVWTVQPTFFGAPLACFVARASGAVSWLHVQDFEVDAAFELGLLPAHGPVHRTALWLERLFTGTFTCVSSISASMLERSVQKGVPASHSVLFPNWVDTEAIHPQAPETENTYRRELNLEGKTVLLYSGNMGDKQGLEMLAGLALDFEADPTVHFVFCGNGACRPRLEALVAQRTNVTMLPLQPEERFNDLLNVADIHLVLQKAGAADLMMPSKLTGILASGRPVIATADPGTQLAQVVGGTLTPDGDACGLVVPPENQDALNAAVRALIESPEQRALLGAAARNYAVNFFEREQVLGKFERDLFKVVNQNRFGYTPEHRNVLTA